MENIKTYEGIIEHITTAHGENARYIFQNGTVQQELEFVRWSEENGNAEDYTYRYALERINRAIEHMLTPATIKVGDGVTIKYWSDRHAATVIKVTNCTVTVQRDKATLDPNFKPEWIAGGFAGHCTNQDEQTYTYERDPKGEIKTFRWSNRYGRYGQPNDLQLFKGRHEFYDYNF